MKKIRGFRLGRKLVKVFKWIARPRRRGKFGDSLLGHTTRRLTRRLCSFAAFLRRGTKGLCHSESDPGYIKLGVGGKEAKRAGVPKGHLAVYVGESEGNTKRVVVPLIYFNHPLFGELLKEAERVYGFNQSGGITLPCGISEFEKVKMRIADWNHCRRKQHHGYL